MSTMSAYELRRQYRHARPHGPYFNPTTMRFFGDSMRNYGVRDAGEYWELYRKHPVAHGLCMSAYFHKITFQVKTNLPEAPCP